MAGDMFFVTPLHMGGEAGGEAEYRRPPWTGPPSDVLGIVAHLGLVLGRSERGAVGLSHAIAYPEGVYLEFLACARGLTRTEANLVLHEQHMFDRDDLPDGLLRLGVELPGGARASNVGDPAAYLSEEEPEGPVFAPCGGGGGEGGSDRMMMRNAYWLWPLPEPGPIVVGCEWPIVEIGLATVEVDGAALVAAAAGVTKLWP